MSDDNLWVATDQQRLAITIALTRFLSECARTAEAAYEDGARGYVGTFKLLAHADDDGLSFRVERSFEESL